MVFKVSISKNIRNIPKRATHTVSDVACCFLGNTGLNLVCVFDPSPSFLCLIMSPLYHHY